MSTGEILLIMIVFNTFMALMGYIDFLKESSKPLYIEYLDLLRKQNKNVQSYLLKDCIDTVLSFMCIGALPNAFFLVFILEKT